MHAHPRAAHPKPVDETEKRAQRRVDAAYALGLGVPLRAVRPEVRAELEDDDFLEDLEDAMLLAAYEWVPSALADIHALPHGVVEILPTIRKGMAARRSQPTVGKGTIGQPDEV